MLALAASILASTLFSLTIKAAHRRGCTLLAVGATNYLTAAVIYLAASVVTFVRLGHRLPAPRTILLGVGTGVLFVTAFVFIAELQPRKGISITTAALRLSVLFPVAASLLFWGERARGLQVAGMGLALAALPLLGFTRSGPAAQDGGAGGARARSGLESNTAAVHRPPVDVIGLLITAALFVANGLVSVAIRLYYQIGASEEKVYYFAALFLTTAVVSRAVLAVARGKVGRTDVLPGMLLGVWNTGSSFMLLVALGSMPGFVAFPLQSALGLVLTAAAAIVFWGEQVSAAGVAGIILAVGAAVLLNQ